MAVIQKKEPKVVRLNDFWSNFLLLFFALGLGFTLRIIIDLLKR